MSQIYESILDTIGDTPLIHLKRLSKPFPNQIYGKFEASNPGGSVKDRIAKAMIEDAEEQGRITPNTTLIEPTSGNTGIGLAMAAAVKGYSLILVMPDSMSKKRRQLLTAFGAEIKLTSGSLGMKGAVEEAENLRNNLEDAYILQQFQNKANPHIHYLTTGPEIWSQTQGKIDVFVAGVGTGGTITGVGKYLKEQNQEVEIVAVEPQDSAVLSGHEPGSHRIQGIGAGFIPDILNTKIIDKVIPISNDSAEATTRRLVQEEGILAGISSGAAVAAAFEIAEDKSRKNQVIVTILPDTGERYLSTSVFL